MLVPHTISGVALGIWLSLGLLVPSGLFAQDPFAGTFRGDGLTLVLRADGVGGYQGEAEEDGIHFQVEGRSEGSILRGSYAFQGQTAPFTARIDGEALVVEAAGDRYTLYRAGGEGLGALETSVSSTDTSVAGPPGADEVDHPGWGLRFRIPSGWGVGEHEEETWVLFARELPGFLVVSELELESRDTLAQLLSGEITEEGVRLQPEGPMEEVGVSGMMVRVTGTLQGADIQGYAGGVVSPHGPGLSVLVAAETGSLEAGHEAAALALLQSVRFRPPPVEGDADWWRARLAGQRIVRLSRTSTQGGGSQSRTTVTLCRDGHGGYMWTYSMSLSVDGVFANNSDQDQGEGPWEVAIRQGQPILIMRLQDGRVFEWTLAMEDDRIHLDGNQYLRDTSPC